MARDIEDFLRRAAERRKQQQAGRTPPARQPAQQQPARQPPRQQPPRQQPRRPSPPPLIIDDDDVQVVRNKKGLREQSVSDHVDAYIDTSDIAENAAHMGERIIGEAKRIDKQVHSHLDHDMTALDDNPSIQDEPGAVVHRTEAPPMAKELIRMLSSPSSFRQAILINEILKRPSFDDGEELSGFDF